MESQAEYWNIDPAAGQVLQAIIHVKKPKKILEVGTSNGYSAILMGKVASLYGGHITTIEFFGERFELAKKNIAEANLSETIEVLQGDAVEIMERFPLLTKEGLGEVSDTQLTPSNSPFVRGREPLFDFIFLDANKQEYTLYFKAAMKIINPHGIIVADNTVSHAKKISAFFQAVSEEPRAQALELSIGTGLMIISTTK